MTNGKAAKSYSIPDSPDSPSPVQQGQGLPAISTATLATSGYPAYPSGNYSTTNAPVPFLGAAHKMSGSSVAGILAILAAIAFAM